MNALAAILDDLAPLAVERLVDALEARPRLAARLRELLGVTELSPTPIFLSRRRYAERVDLGLSSVDGLIKRGLPVVGKGKLLRIDVRAADEWLRQHLSSVSLTEGQAEQTEDEDAEIDRLARANAMRVAGGSRR